MPTITVSALITDGDHLLLARRAGEQQLELPGGLLTDGDETVEDALVRSLRGTFGLAIGEPEFLDTLYERRADEVVVHNVFAVPRAESAVRFAGMQGGIELRWVPIQDLGQAPLPAWLADVLPALLAGEDPPQAEIEWGALPGGSGAQRHAAASVVIITGPAGAGKSTVARGLCARFQRAAHIPVDDVRHMVRAGYASPVPGDSDPSEAARQDELAQRNAAILARNFAEAGFVALIDDVIERPEELDRYLVHLVGLDVAFVTLLPDAETVHRRDAERSPELFMGLRAGRLHQVFAANGETRGLRLDTSNWSVDETVEAILERLSQAQVAAGYGEGEGIEHAAADRQLR